LRVNAEKKEERERVALALLQATLALAAAHGFSSLGLREVSRAAGIAPTSFYRHFADMEALGLELIKNLVGRVVRHIAAAPASSEPLERALSIVSRALAATAEEPELFRFVLAEHNGSIASFRKGVREQLSVVSQAIPGDPASKGPPHPDDCDAVVLLVLDGCGEVLEHGPERLPAVRARLERQSRAILAATTVGGGRQ
jgi:AcrR family transcriptional regulator